MVGYLDSRVQSIEGFPKVGFPRNCELSEPINGVNDKIFLLFDKDFCISLRPSPVVDAIASKVLKTAKRYIQVQCVFICFCEIGR